MGVEARNLGNLLIKQLRSRGSEVALSTPTHRLTGDECASRAEGFAAGLLRAGVSIGDRVAVMLPNRPEFPIANVGSWRVGAVHMPVNVMLSGREAEELFTEAHPEVLVVDRGARERLGRAVDGIPTVVVVDDDLAEWRDFCRGRQQGAAPDIRTATLAYTSGTTGRPKGALLAADQIDLSLEVVSDVFGLGRDECILQVLPYFHSNTTLMGVVLAWWLGARAAMLPRFDPESLAHLIEAEEVSFGACVPTIMYDVVDASGARPEQWASLRYLLFGAMQLAPGVRERFEDITGVRTINSYGMTEAPNAVACDPVDRAPKPGTVGHALPHVDISALGEEGQKLPPGEVGELAISSRQDGSYAGRYRPLLGYWNQPTESAQVLADGRFLTGDLGMVDEEGIVAVTDRKKDMISTAGNKVYPAELERVLGEDARISEIYVVGKPDERRGEVPVAFVVPSADAELGEDDVRAIAERHLAKYKQLQEVFVRRAEELPRTALGKVQKNHLRHSLSAGSGMTS